MSQSRRCDLWKASDNKWYVMLGDFEYADDDEDCTTYGPFPSLESAEKYISDNFANPGCRSTDESGDDAPPSNPVAPIRRRFGGIGVRPYSSR